MTLPRMVVFGEALTDIVQHKPGEWQGYPGGAPWNVARTLSRLGVKTAFAGSVSNDSLGDEIVAQSMASGLDMRFIQRVNADPLVAIVPSSHPPRYFFAGEADLLFTPDLLPAQWLDHADSCHFSCISLTRQPLDDKLLSIAQAAKKCGKTISFDPNWRNVMDTHYRNYTYPSMLALADTVKFSDEDLRNIYPGLSESEALYEIRQLNPKAEILLTRGERGLSLYTSETAYEQAAIPICVSDTVGAGDASMAGWLASRLLGIHEASQRLEFSAACASLSCSDPGAYSPDHKEVLSFLNKTKSGQ